MKLKSTNIFTARIWATLLPVLLSACLTACGGGNGSAGSPIGSGTGTGGSTGTTPVLTVAAVSPASPAKLAAYGSAQLTFQVNANGAADTAQPVTVTFTSACVATKQATLPTTATTSASNGQVVVTYTDNGCGKADTVQATVTSGSSATTGSTGATAAITLTIAQPTVQSINFVSIVPATSSIVFAGVGASGRSSAAVLTFQVVDQNGNPVAGVPVTFTNNNSGLATLGQTSGITQTGTGQVTVSLNAVGANNGVYPAAGTLAVTATAPVSTTPAVSVSATSSNVIVSTGQPVQEAFTMAAKTYNLSGIDYYGTTTKVVFFLSDANGNPVVDGTPVAATTNEGGISGLNGTNPGCTTVNGQCQLTFTTQLPVSDVDAAGDTEYGIATVIGTSTNNSTQLTSEIKIYMSGNSPLFYLPTGGGLYTATSGGDSISIGAECKGTVSVFVSDEVGNPMASGDPVSVTSSSPTVLTIGTVSPNAILVQGNSNPAYALTAAANLTNYLSFPIDPNTGKPRINKYIFASRIDIPVTLAAPCVTGGTPNVGAAQFSIKVTDTVTNVATTSLDFNITFPE